MRIVENAVEPSKKLQNVLVKAFVLSEENYKKSFYYSPGSFSIFLSNSRKQLSLWDPTNTTIASMFLPHLIKYLTWQV